MVEPGVQVPPDLADQLTLAKDYYIDGQNIEKMSTGRGKQGPQITPQGWIFWTMIFYNLKKFTPRSI